MKEERNLLDEFIRHLPLMRDRIVNYEIFDTQQILIKCKDGSKILYDGWRQIFRFIDPNKQDVLEMEPKRYAIEFGHRLAAKMYQKGYSPETLSEETGISRSLLYRYLSGDSMASFYNVIKIASILKCDVNEFIRIPK